MEGSVFSTHTRQRVGAVCRTLRVRLFLFVSIHKETRIALLAILVENESSVEDLNDILHQYRQYIIGRMGIPYREKQVSIMSIAVDAPQDVISALSGKIGKLPGVSSKTAYAGGGRG